MLQPPPSDPTPDAEAGAARAQRPKPVAPTLALDPTWRAGRKLSEARQQLGLSLEAVAERIRVRREFLEALETMNMKLLPPGRVYALSFLRSYARELGLDEKAIVDQFQDECALTREDARRQIRNPTSRPHPERPWLAAAALVAMAAGFVGLQALRREQPAAADREASVTAAAPGLLAADAASPMATERRVVEVRALAPAWLEARGPDGTVFFSRNLGLGDVYRPDPSPGWTLHAQDGGAFDLFVDGVAAGPLGPLGMPVLGKQIDEIQPLAQASLPAPRS